ncbi:hypothetical protein KL906_000066 [Ogataea polymorpha]|uniref:uncharacterized protein n=1 Tax=Ogataea polymorpha TaxID=460523 RepID=UPI0007F49A5C|nr:uncharacterized protein OGAPODRAFT_15520 [Ogataea polymorpha]KAG7896664.1 hypothetical protein KL908_000066 [Ogataea polymorpha]KAG7911862.1 hypothetical protein KL906_000066 [Ogataea polymorpha]KAG7920373.1 hypothetical protein KL927_001053 [Ogataea polymorpha]KAG7938480.1 hypothetical protein KL934_001054 [Ogataea polymorpha]OBA17099.1 hypothetical protein OGAPODRAFT_15520 [Ogataea polymorpha]
MADLKSSTPKAESWTNQAQHNAHNAYDRLSGSKDTPRSVQHSSVPGSFDFEERKDYSAGDSNYTSQSQTYDSTSPTFKASEGEAHGEPAEQPSLANKLMSAIGIGGSSEGATSPKDKPLAGEDATKNSVSTKTLEKQVGKAHSYVDSQGNEFEVIPTDRNVKYSSLVDPVVDERDIRGTQDNIKGLSDKERARRLPVEPTDTKNANDSQSSRATAEAGAGAAAGHYGSSNTHTHSELDNSGSHGKTLSSEQGYAGQTTDHQFDGRNQKSDLASKHDTTDKNLGPQVPGAGVGSLAGAPGQTYHPKQSQVLETQEGYGSNAHASKQENARDKGYSNTGATTGAGSVSGKPTSYNTTEAAATDPVHGATAPADLGDYRHPIGEQAGKSTQGTSHKAHDKYSDLSQNTTAASKSNSDHHSTTETAAGVFAGAGLGATAGHHEKSTSSTSDSSEHGSGSGAGSKSGKSSKWGKSNKKNDDNTVQHGTVYQDVHHDSFATRNADQLKSDSSRLYESEKKGRPEFAQKQAELGYETAHGGSHAGGGKGIGAGIGAAVASAVGYKAASHDSSHGKQQTKQNDASTQELRAAPGVTKTQNDPYDSSYSSQSQTDDKAPGSLDPKNPRKQVDYDKVGSQAKDLSQKGGQHLDKSGHGEYSAYATGAGTAIGAGAGYLGSREAGKDSATQANASAQKDPELAKGGFRETFQGGDNSRHHTQRTNKYTAGVGDTAGRDEPETNKYTAGVGGDEPHLSSGYTAGVGDTHPHHAKDQYTAGVRDDKETPYTAGFSDTTGQSKYASGSDYGAAGGATGAGIAAKSQGSPKDHLESQSQSYGKQGASYGATQQTSTGQNVHIPGTRDNLPTQNRGQAAHGNEYLNEDQNALASRAAAAATQDKRGESGAAGTSDLRQSSKAHQKGDEAYSGQPRQGESNTKILNYDEFEQAHPQKEKLSTKIKKIFN